MKKLLFWAVVATLMLFGSQPIEAAKKPSLVKSTSIKVGNTKKIKIKGSKIKKTSWSVRDKKIVTLSKKKKNSVTIKGKKKGSTVLTAKTKIGKKTYKRTCKIAVKNIVNISLPKKDVKKFSGRVWTTFTDEGYIRIKWDKVPKAYTYSVQRMEASGSWKNLKTTAKQFLTDRSVKEFSSYAYRVRANCTDVNTAYSLPVVVVTGNITNSISGETNTNVSTTPKPQLTPEPTPYQAKYSYEVEVLNKFTIYENVPVVLHIKTDNPDPNNFDETYVSVSGGSGSCGYCYSYEDIEYLNDEEDKQSTDFRKVKDGFIYTIQFQEPGIKNVEIQELDSYDWHTVDTFEIEVHDGTEALQQHCNNIIQKVSAESYNEDERGKWDDLTPQDKMERLEDYVRGHLHYPRIGALTVFGYETVWYIQENVGAYWETGFADCGASNDMMCVLARTLGYEASLKSTISNGMLHIQAAVTIDGTEYIYDATPWQGGYKDWDYIL